LTNHESSFAESGRLERIDGTNDREKKRKTDIEKRDAEHEKNKGDYDAFPRYKSMNGSETQYLSERSSFQQDLALLPPPPPPPPPSPRFYDSLPFFLSFFLSPSVGSTVRTRTSNSNWEEGEKVKGGCGRRSGLDSSRASGGLKDGLAHF
jgi:hypothetical protein